VIINKMGCGYYPTCEECPYKDKCEEAD